MEWQARPLITGRVPLKGEQWVNEATKALRLKRAHSASLARFARSLKRDGLERTSIRVQLRPVSRRWDAGVLVVEAKKRVASPYRVRSGGKPVVMRQVLDVTLRYRQTGGKWRAVSTKTLRPPTAPREPLEDPTFRFPLPGGSADQTRVADVGTRSAYSQPGLAETGIVLAEPGGTVGVQGLSKAQKEKVRDYARKWAKGHNPKYGDQWAKDCTNFVSQSVRAGGWKFVGDGSLSQRVMFEKWGFYDMDPWSDFTWTTYTWGAAENFYQFGRFHSKRLIYTNRVSNLKAGDLLQAKWKYEKLMSHSMVVTKVKNGERFLSYHTDNPLNKPFKEIKKAHKGATWFPLQT